MDHFGEFPGLEWFHDDLVGFEKDSVHGALHVRVAADQQRKGIRLGVAHRGDHRETITRVRHVEVSYEHVEGLGGDKVQGFYHAGGRNYVKSFAFKGHTHHAANRFIVIHQQDSVRNARFGLGSHNTTFRYGEYDLVSFLGVYQIDQCALLNRHQPRKLPLMKKLLKCRLQNLRGNAGTNENRLIAHHCVGGRISNVIGPKPIFSDERSDRAGPLYARPNALSGSPT